MPLEAEVKRQRPQLGDIFQIKLDLGIYVYGQVIPNGITAFYSYSDDGLADLDLIVDSNLLFCILVMDDVLKKGTWPIVGNRPVPNSASGKIEFCRKDTISGELIISYYSDDGQYCERPGTIDECQNLEATCAWSEEHVIDRLEDIFSGKEDRWRQATKVS